MVLKSQLPHKTVDLIFSSVMVNNKLTVFVFKLEGNPDAEDSSLPIVYRTYMNLQIVYRTYINLEAEDGGAIFTDIFRGSTCGVGCRV